MPPLYTFGAIPFSIEFGVKYTIIGPNGDRAVLNDPTDADFVGFLIGDNAVTGLEGATVRDNSATIPESNGRVQARNYLDGLTFTLNGQIVGADASQTLARGDRLLRATAARKADATLSWTPTDGLPVQVKFRAQQRTTIQNRRPKNFLVAGVSESSYVETADEVLLTVPYHTQGGPENRGSGESWPRYVLRGVINNPTIKLSTPNTPSVVVSFLQIDASLTLPAETLTIETNPRFRRVTYKPSSGGILEDWTDKVRWSTSTWGPLEGQMLVDFGSDTTTSPGVLEVNWRHTWG